MPNDLANAWYRLGLAVGLLLGVWLPAWVHDLSVTAMGVFCTALAAAGIGWGLWGLVTRKRDAMP